MQVVGCVLHLPDFADNSSVFAAKFWDLKRDLDLQCCRCISDGSGPNPGLYLRILQESVLALVLLINNCMRLEEPFYFYQGQERILTSSKSHAVQHKT
jgi:hypothetical protein